MPSNKNGGAKANPGRVRTGLSRSVLLVLEEGEATVDQIVERITPRSEGVNNGTVWTILERARLNGLVTCGVKAEQKRPYRYSLTEGGVRRVKWIKGKLKMKLRPAPRVAANPVEEEE